MAENVDKDEEKAGEPEKQRYWTSGKIATAFVVSVGKFVQLLCCLGLAPFYPEEAMERGNSSIEIGIVFGIYPLVGFLCSPLVGKLLSKGFAPKKVLCCGLLIDCCFMAMFSMLYKIHDSTWFFAGSVLCRGIQSVGVTLSSVTYYGIAAARFPDKMTLFIPIIETMSGFGVMVGPTIGGILHQIGGFPVPFWTFAAMTFVFLIITASILPAIKMAKDPIEDVPPEEKVSRSMKKIIGDCRMLIDVAMVFAGFVTIAFNDATLAVLLDRFGLNSAYKGAAFLISACCYSVASITYGQLGKKLKDIRLIGIFGGICLVVAWAFMSPMPFFQFESELWLVLVCQALLGIGAGAFYICSYSHGHLYLTEIKGFPDDYMTYSVMAGVIQSSFFLGSLSGATGGGILLQYFGYGWTTTIIVAIMVLLSIAITGVVVSDKLRPPVPRMKPQSSVQNMTELKMENGERPIEMDSVKL